MPHTCLDDKTTQLFALGRLSKAEAASVTEHLKTCTSCQDEVLRAQCETFVETHTGTMEGHTWLEGFAMIAMRDAETSGRDVTDRSGQTIAGRYQLEESVGAGGMGHVYAASDTQLGGRLVAVKLLKREIQSDGFRQRFEREKLNAAKLEHENIMRVYDGGIHEGEAYLVTELLDGETIKETLDSRERICLSDACAWVRQAATGLSAAHKRGIVHRDVSPSNLLVTQDGKVKLIDFGISISEDLELGVTSTSQIVGALRYMSPEQRNPEESVDHRTDIYSLGLVLHELIYGHVPRGSLTEMAEKSRGGELVDPEIRALIGTMLGEPEMRPSLATVREVLAETAARSPSDSTSGRTPLPAIAGTPPNKPTPWNSRTALLAFAAFGLVIAAGIVIQIYRQDGSVEEIAVGERDRVVITQDEAPSDTEIPTPRWNAPLEAPVLTPPKNADTDGIFAIRWQPVPGASFYQVAEFPDTKTWKELNIHRASGGTSTTIKKVESGDFLYRVIAWAQDSQGAWKHGPYSDPIVQKVNLAPDDLPLDAPAVDPPESPDTNGTFTVRWQPVAGANFYQVAEFPSSTSWEQVSLHRVDSKTSTTLTRPENGTYTCRVIAWGQDAQGNWIHGPFSDAVEVVVKNEAQPAPEVPPAGTPGTSDDTDCTVCRSLAEWAIGSGGYVGYRTYLLDKTVVTGEAHHESELPKDDFWINRLVVRNVSVSDKVALFPELVGMTGLVLTSARVGDDDIREIAVLRKLRWLYLGKTQITDASISEINKLSKLESLSIGAPAITDQGVSRLGDFEHLTSIFLDTAQITDEAVASLQRFPKLHSIGLAHTGVTDDGVAKLAHFKELDCLDLEGCSNLTDKVIEHLAECKGLKKLTLKNTELAPAAIDSLKAKLPDCKISD